MSQMDKILTIEKFLYICFIKVRKLNFKVINNKMTILLCITEFTKSADLKCSHQKEKKRKRQLCELMVILISSIVVIISQCI